jgi:hypothetical protein
MNRRDFLRGSSLGIGAYFSSHTLAALAQSLPVTSNVPRFLNKDEFLLISQLSEIIIPRTDTPGAIDVGVPNTMDAIFFEVLKPDEQEKLRAGINAFNQLTKKAMGKPFLGLSPAKQQAFAKKLNINRVRAGSPEARLIADYKKSLPEETINQAIEFFGVIKYFTLEIFFRSEPGATKVLQFVAIPGHYNGSALLKDIGKTWATD